MEVIQDVTEMRAWSRAQRAQGITTALVPTMGSLHAGHLSLIELAKAHSDRVVVSIYVNPTQFAAHEDYGVYPRGVDDDIECAAKHTYMSLCCSVAAVYYRSHVLRSSLHVYDTAWLAVRLVSDTAR